MMVGDFLELRCLIATPRGMLPWMRPSW